jgi:thymidylate synthase
MERYWTPELKGIRYNYGNLRDVVDLLAKEPLTRQAYLPVWFPEDTGATGRRVPCSLGYHFIQRSGFFHIVYYIRSCDFTRHFRDDIYLTYRLWDWVLRELQKEHSFWKTVELGMFTMHISSLHMFINDYNIHFKHR